MLKKEKVKKPKNYKFVGVLAKILHPTFNVLFYITAVFIFLFIILTVILFFVNMPVEEMLLPPFMNKIMPYNNPILEAYVISLGNGVKITTFAENVSLENIKIVFFAGINVVVFVLLTVAPIFRFAAALLDNINKKKYFDIKNARYIMFIGLCVSIGTVIIRFMTQFYNYYLLTQFITDASQDIAMHLRVDILSGIAGLVIILTGIIFAYICQIYNENLKIDKDKDDKNDENTEHEENSDKNIKDIAKK